MTLEASLIMPMVLCVIALLCYFSFYLYGRCILSQDSYILAFRASVEKSDNWKDDPAGYVAAKSRDVAGKKYFRSEEPSFSTRVEGKTIRVHGTSAALHSAMGRYFLKPVDGWEYEAAGKATRRDYAGHIRKLTRIRDLGEMIVDYGGE